MNYEDVYRTAPATPNLLNIITISKKVINLFDLLQYNNIYPKEGQKDL